MELEPIDSKHKDIPSKEGVYPLVKPALMSLIVFACVFTGALLGMFLRTVMPKHHFDVESKEVITLGMGLIATLAALVLGLVIASAKSSYDLQELSVKQISAKFLLLDRQLAQYGPEMKESRDLIRRALVHRLNETWPEESSPSEKPDAPEDASRFEGFENRIRQLVPQNDAQRGLQSRALETVSQILEARWFMLGGGGSSVPLPFLIVVVFWLTVIFGGFGLFAPRNATVVAVLFVCALSVAGAIFLILEMEEPFSGLIKISSTPLRYALSHLSP